MRPGIFAGQVVLAVFAVLALVALVLPWWRRSRIRRAPTGLKLALSLTATIAIGFLLLNTLRDVEHTTTAGKRMCGGSYLFMLDTRLEITENLYHDCIVYSRVAIALLIALLVSRAHAGCDVEITRDPDTVVFATPDGQVLVQHTWPAPGVTHVSTHGPDPTNSRGGRGRKKTRLSPMS